MGQVVRRGAQPSVVRTHEGAPSKLRLGGCVVNPNRMAKSKKFDLKIPFPSSMMKTRKLSPPLMKVCRTLKPVRPCLRRKSDASYLSGLQGLTDHLHSEVIGDLSGRIRAMPTVLRSGPYRFYFYSHEPNEPPHIHVDRDDLSAKFWLDPAGAQFWVSRQRTSHYTIGGDRAQGRVPGGVE